MRASSVVAWLAAILVVAYAMACTTILLARSFLAAASNVAAALLGGMLEGLASYLTLLMAMEIVAAAVQWATRGPILGVAWIYSRVSMWVGH